MKGIRCQLCDGAISNGRCRTCGMPYRNDEVLYHLNESSHDHYKHATPKAKEIMRQNRKPLGDRPAYSGKNIQNRNVSNRNMQSRNTQAGAFAQTSDRLMSKEQIRIQQEKVRQEAMAKINSTKVPNKNAGSNPKTKKKGLGGFWWIIVLFYIIFGAITRNI